MSMRAFLSLACGIAVTCFSYGTDSPPLRDVQVLLQGKNLTALAALIDDVGGTVTHELPIVSGMGGTVSEHALPRLRAHSAVNHLTEDFNPIVLKEPRDCAIGGGLDMAISHSSVTWSVYNFSTEDERLAAMNLQWADTFGMAEITLKHPATGNTLTAFNWPAKESMPSDILLPPGITEIGLTFNTAIEPPTQNDLAIELSLANCSTKLPKAYKNNHENYYFPQISGADLLHKAGITGRGVGVAIIDSGLWDTAALTTDATGSPRVVGHYDARKHQENAPLVDLGGHGSHMASIIANSSSITSAETPRFLGMAPNASLVPITTFDPRGDADFMDIIRAIQWAVTNKDRLNIRVLNMSLSATPQVMYWDEPLNQAILKAWQAGILVVAAMGNDGPDWGTVGSPANNPYVLSVGAVTDSWTADTRNDDYIPDFSSRGPTPAGHIKPDVVAPGGHITGIIPRASQLAVENPNYLLTTGEFVSTGSSQAAAVVSGMAALLFQADPMLSNDDVKCLITTSAEPAINRDGRLAYSPFTQGAGYANVSRALTLGSTDCQQQALDIDAAVRGEETLTGPAESTVDGSPTLPNLELIVTSESSEKGLSDQRRWGVTEHLKRLNVETEQPQSHDGPLDWGHIYERERKKIERLSRPEIPSPQQ